MTTYLVRVTCLLGIAFACSQNAFAQLLSPFFIHDGIAAATTKAKTDLGPDAVLVYAGTFGNFDASQFQAGLGTLHFYQDSVKGTLSNIYPGMADAWGYVFYSKTKDSTEDLVVVKVPLLGMSAQNVPAPIPLPPGLTSELDMTPAGTHSDAMMRTLKTNATYTTYHQQYPLKEPDFVTLGALDSGLSIPGLPNGTTWSLNWIGNKDTMNLNCFVSTTTSDVVCLTTPAAGIDDATGLATSQGVTLSAAPLPATGRTRLFLHGVDPVLVRRGASVALFDSRGALVLDLTESFARNDFQFAEFDAAGLQAGMYYCRVTGKGWSAVVGVPAEGR